jgi:hypothetical protein
LRTYETPTLMSLGSFAECTGRGDVGVFADFFDWDWGPSKFDPKRS